MLLKLIIDIHNAPQVIGNKTKAEQLPDTPTTDQVYTYVMANVSGIYNHVS